MLDSRCVDGQPSALVCIPMEPEAAEVEQYLQLAVARWPRCRPMCLRMMVLDAMALACELEVHRGGNL